MTTVLQASNLILNVAGDLFQLAHLRLACAPVDDEILSRVAEISKAIDVIRDNIAEGSA